MKSKIKNQKSKIKNIIFVLLVLFAFSEIQAQRRDFNFRFIAKIMDADTAIVIPRCHIINKTLNLGTTSDDFGTFMITANVGDSIMFSSLGYERLTIAVHDSMYTNSRTIRLKPTAYILTALDVGLFSTYERFRRDILSMEAQKAYDLAFDVSRFEVFTPPLPNHGGINVPFAGSPVTFLYNLWSVEGKNYRQYLSVINGTAEFIIIGEKFNGFIVREMTGFENDELVKFMSYCRFSKEYLLAANEMEIRRAIMSKYREYVNN